MKEYISKDFINNLLDSHLKHCCGPEHYTCSFIKDEINGAPDSAIIYMYECSECGAISNEFSQFCPYCGKPMEVELDG